MKSQHAAAAVLFVIAVPLLRISEQLAIDLLLGPGEFHLYMAVAVWSLVISVVVLGLTWKWSTDFRKSFWYWTVVPTLVACVLTIFNASAIRAVPISAMIVPTLFAVFYWMLAFVPAWYIAWKLNPWGREPERLSRAQ